jgi:RibD C-terminal domain
LNCDPAEAVRIGLAAADGKNLEVFSPTIGRQLLDLGLIDEIDLHIVPVLLGDGIRLYDNPGGAPVRLHRVGDSDPASAVNVRYRPASSLWTVAAEVKPDWAERAAVIDYLTGHTGYVAGARGRSRKPQFSIFSASFTPAAGPVAGLPRTTPISVRPFRTASNSRQCRAVSV